MGGAVGSDVKSDSGAHGEIAADKVAVSTGGISRTTNGQRSCSPLFLCKESKIPDRSGKEAVNSVLALDVEGVDIPIQGGGRNSVIGICKGVETHIEFFAVSFQNIAVGFICSVTGQTDDSRVAVAQDHIAVLLKEDGSIFTETCDIDFAAERSISGKIKNFFQTALEIGNIQIDDGIFAQFNGRSFDGGVGIKIQSAVEGDGAKIDTVGINGIEGSGDHSSFKIDRSIFADGKFNTFSNFKLGSSQNDV